MTEKTIVSAMRDCLSKHFDIERIILFGSRATGKAGPESDWDVLIIAESSLPFVERQGRALAALGQHDYPLDLLLYTPEEAEEAAAIPGSAIYWAKREGRVVYAK